MSIQFPSSNNPAEMAEKLKASKTQVQQLNKNLILPESGETRTEQARLMTQDLADLGKITGGKILSQKDRDFATDLQTRLESGGTPSRSDINKLKGMVDQAIKVLSNKAQDVRVDSGKTKDWERVSEQTLDKFSALQDWIPMQADIIKGLTEPSDVAAFHEQYQATLDNMEGALVDLKGRGTTKRYDELIDQQIAKFQTLGKPQDPEKLRKSLEKEAAAGNLSSAEVEHLLKISATVDQAVKGRKEALGDLDTKSLQVAWTKLLGKDGDVEVSKKSATEISTAFKEMLDQSPEDITADQQVLMKATLGAMRRAGFRDITLESRVTLFQPLDPNNLPPPPEPPTGMPESRIHVADFNKYMDGRITDLTKALDKKAGGLPEDSPQRDNMKALITVSENIRNGSLSGAEALEALDKLKGKDFGFTGLPAQLDGELRGRVKVDQFGEAMKQKSELTMGDISQLQTILKGIPGGKDYQTEAQSLMDALPKPTITSTVPIRGGPLKVEDWENRDKPLDEQLQMDVQFVARTLYPDKEAVKNLRAQIERGGDPEALKAFDKGMEAEAERRKFLTRSLLTQAMGLTFTPKDHSDERRFDLPLAATISHGNRVHFRLAPDLQQQFGSYGFNNWLTSGSTGDATKPHTSTDGILQKRGASSHSASFGPQGAKETKEKLGNFTNQFGIDLTFGGLGSLTPDGQSLGFGGIPYDEDDSGRLTPSDHIQSGHILVRPMADDKSGWGSVIIGNEGCGPGKTDYWGKGHGITGAFMDSSRDATPTGGDKFDILAKKGHTVPDKYEGMHVTLDRSKMETLMKISEAIESLPPDQQEAFVTALAASNQQDAEQLLRTQFPGAF